MYINIATLIYQIHINFYWQNIADCFSNLLSPENNAGWMELEEVSYAVTMWVFAADVIAAVSVTCCMHDCYCCFVYDGCCMMYISTANADQ